MRVRVGDRVSVAPVQGSLDQEDLREGLVAKYMGDGVLVYFGYPQAHEDDAERAVRAGLELIAAMTALESRAALQTRVGIATGLVVAGEIAGCCPNRIPRRLKRISNVRWRSRPSRRQSPGSNVLLDELAQ